MSAQHSLKHLQQKPEVSHLPNLSKKHLKLKLNTSHKITLAILSLETEQDALKDQSNISKSFKRMSAGMRYLSSSTNSSYLTIISENLDQSSSLNPKGLVPSQRNPESKCNSNSVSMWMKKHGSDATSSESRAFLSFLKLFFDALDENESGTLTSNEIVIPLLSLGLANDSLYIERALLSIFEVSDLQSLSFTKEKFISLFKNDKKVDLVLKAICSDCVAMLKEEEKITAEQMANRRSSLIRQNSTSDTPLAKFPSVEEMIRLVKKWWDGLAGEGGKANISKIGEFLAEKGIVSNKHEGRAFAKTFDSSTFFQYWSFEKIFLKGVLKACLFNVAEFLTRSDFEEFSVRLKLTILQRRMMMAGAKFRNDALAKKGRITLVALDKFNKKTGTSLVNEKSSVFAEEINEEKIAQLLFKLKENAQRFVDDCGQVKSFVKSIWDVRSGIAEEDEEAISPTPKFKEEKYLSVLNEKIAETPHVVPYKRKIRLFRENFLYRKFSKMIKVCPRHNSI